MMSLYQVFYYPNFLLLMFSWIIESKAKILWIESGKFLVENTLHETVTIGQSVAHDGACMTIEKWDEKSYSFFAMEESFKKTNFWKKKIWDFFNVERCLKVGDRIDGHFVSWHIDTTGEIKKVSIEADGSKIITILFPREMRKYLIEKWSIAVNWASLTLFDIKEDSFNISLIPFTQQITNLGNLKESDTVNLEFDMIWKYIMNEKYDEGLSAL